jgi:hypothetical protein
MNQVSFEKCNARRIVQAYVKYLRFRKAKGSERNELRFEKCIRQDGIEECIKDEQAA